MLRYLTLDSIRNKTLYAWSGIVFLALLPGCRRATKTAVPVVFDGIISASVDPFGVTASWNAAKLGFASVLGYAVFVSENEADLFSGTPAVLVPASAKTARVLHLPSQVHRFFAVRVRLASGEFDSNTHAVGVDTAPPPGTLSPAASSHYVPGDVSFTLHLQINPDDLAKVVWDFGDGNSVESNYLDQTLAFQASDTGDRTVQARLLNQNGEDFGTSSSLRLFLLPTLTLTSTLSPPMTATFHVALAGVNDAIGLALIEWDDLGKGFFETGDLDRTTVFTKPGQHTVRVRASFQDGSTVEAETTVSMNGAAVWVSSPLDRAVLGFSDPTVAPPVVVERIGDQTGLASPIAMALDEGRSLLYAAVLTPEPAILAFNPSAGANAAPVRRIAGGLTFLENPVALAVSAVTGQVAVADGARILLFGTSDDGDVSPKRILEGTSTRLVKPRAVAFGPDGGILAGDGQNILVFAPGVDGSTAPASSVAMAFPIRALATFQDETWVAGDRGGLAMVQNGSVTGQLRPAASYAPPLFFSAVGVNADSVYVVSSQRIDVFARPLTSPAAPVRAIVAGLGNAVGLALSTSGMLVLDAARFGRVLGFPLDTNDLAYVDARVGGEYRLGVAYADDSGELYVGQQPYYDQEVQVFRRGSDGNFESSAYRSIAGGNTGFGGYVNGLAVTQTELFVTLNRGNAMVVHDRAASGNAAPLRTVGGNLTNISNPGYPAIDTVAAEVYIPNAADAVNGSVTVFTLTANGNVSPLRMLAGASTLLKEPFAVAVDSANGELYVSDRTTRAVLVFGKSDNGNVAPRRSLVPAAAASPGWLGCIALDVAGGRLFAATTSAGPSEIDVFDEHATGTAAPLASILGTANGFPPPAQIAYSAKTGLLFAAQFGGVVILDPSRVHSHAPATLLAGGDELVQPAGLAYDAQSGTLVVADPGLGGVAVYRRTDGGKMARAATIAGQATGLLRPMAIALDSSGNITVIDGAVRAVSVFAAAASGNVAPLRTIAGTLTKLKQPTAVAASASRLYVSDSSGSVSAFSSSATGNEAPLARWEGPHTGLALPVDLALLDSAGQFAVLSAGRAPSAALFQTATSGDVAPLVSITGARTGLGAPTGIALMNGHLIAIDNGQMLLFGSAGGGNLSPQASYALPGIQSPTRVAVSIPASIR